MQLSLYSVTYHVFEMICSTEQCDFTFLYDCCTR